MLINVNMDIKQIQKKLQEFSENRNWDQFHSPKNLAMALSVEVAELVEIFQWLDNEQSLVHNLDSSSLKFLKEELGDIMIYTIRLADKLNINLEEAIHNKIEINDEKYPIELSKDNAIKYSRR